MFMRGKVILLLLFLTGNMLINVFAQYTVPTDTVSLTIDSTEALFLIRNFDLLAAKYQINEAEARMIQAKLWANPNFSINMEAYNAPSKSWFVIPGGGEYAMSLQQLIHLAGKRNKRINLEKTNTQIAQYEFYDLIRTLRFELRATFYELYFTQQTLSTYDREIAALNLLTDAYAAEYKKGDVPFKELARLQALQFGIENEKIELLKNLSQKQSDLVLLTGDSLSRPVKPVVDLTILEKPDPLTLKLENLLEEGLKSRYDLKIYDSQISSEQINLSLQKAMRIPDISVGANYDKMGGYIPNYNALSLSFDLPFWNRNQGNIKLSENIIEEKKIQKRQKELEVRNEITRAYLQFVETDRLYKSSVQRFNSDYDKLFDGINAAYKNHTISLLEFIDYFDTYKDSKSQYYQLQNNRLGALENLNMATGTTIIK